MADTVPVMITDAEKSILKDRFQQWNDLQELYCKAEQLKEEGAETIEVPIDVFLFAKSIPRNTEEFWKKIVLQKLCSTVPSRTSPTEDDCGPRSYSEHKC
jgi:hypothetical protein